MPKFSDRAVFGEDVQYDAEGNPIERGFGNLTDRAAAAPKTSAVTTESVPVR